MHHDKNFHSYDIESIFRVQKFDAEHLPSLESPQKTTSNTTANKSPNMILSVNSSKTLNYLKLSGAFANFECSPISQDQGTFLRRNMYKKHNTSSLDLTQIDYSSKSTTKIFQFIPKIKAKQKLKPLCKEAYKYLQNKTKYETEIDVNLKNLKIKKYYTVKPQEKMSIPNKEFKTKSSFVNVNHNRNGSSKLDEENLHENMPLKKKMLKKGEKDCKNIDFDKISAISAWEINIPDYCYDNNW
ncbi:hypothetical protein SteCoe_30814 [Stentor coeruleus]|uniref:Uncharacterized protein n=1 Tax=Stentor coeruleus TaxID=5963 RepID=A0A1R2B2Q1_9CILI|nr:hypothetical protein SteCoe_30814 [Stentor coeruleus]